MLATEPEPSDASGQEARPTLLETWSQNERMRHVPSAEWIAAKLDGDVRRRIEHLWLPYSDLPASDPRHPRLEAEFRALCRAIERLCDVMRRHRGSLHPPHDLGHRLPWMLQQAVADLRAEKETFGRRLPFQTLERSHAEPLWGAVLSILDHLGRVLDLVRDIEPEIDEKMLEGLVNLREPLPRQPMVPVDEETR